MYSLDAEARRQAESDRRAATLAAALDEYRALGPLPAWVRPRPSWMQAAPNAENPQVFEEGNEDGWQSTDDLWDGRYAANVLQKVPVAAVMTSAGRAHLVDALEAASGSRAW
jgi:hypothetical protein